MDKDVTVLAKIPKGFNADPHIFSHIIKIYSLQWSTVTEEQVNSLVEKRPVKLNYETLGNITIEIGNGEEIEEIQKDEEWIKATLYTDTAKHCVQADDRPTRYTDHIGYLQVNVPEYLHGDVMQLIRERQG